MECLKSGNTWYSATDTILSSIIKIIIENSNTNVLLWIPLSKLTGCYEFLFKDVFNCDIHLIAIKFVYIMILMYNMKLMYDDFRMINTQFICIEFFSLNDTNSVLYDFNLESCQ